VISQLLPAILFVVFVALAFRAAIEKNAERKLNRVKHFVAYALVVGLFAGFIHREMWPFSRWLVFAYKDVPHSTLVLTAMDISGAEQELDARAMEPFNPVELYTWLSVDFPKLDAQQQKQAAGYLLQLANDGRERALRGEPIGRFGRYFGNFAAPTHFLFTRKWDDRATLTGKPFTSLRIYRSTWEIHQQPVIYHRELLYTTEQH
jgi:hypothetical protein